MSATATETKPEKVSKTKETKAVAVVETPSVDGASLASMFEKSMKAAIPKLGKVTKQNYFRLMNGKNAICYVNASKKHARVNVSVPVSDAADVAEVVAFIQRAVALQAKADASA